MSTETTGSNGDQSWMGAPPLAAIAASQQGGSRGAQIWGVTEDFTLITNFQTTPGGNWSGWSPWGGAPPTAEVAACQLPDGSCQLWIIDTDLQVWSCNQTSPGGYWTQWSGPNWNSAPKLNACGATQQGFNRGSWFWGATENYQLVSCFQNAQREWNWVDNWRPNTPPVAELAACLQNNGNAQLWVLDTSLQVWSIDQDTQGSNWGQWVGPNWGSSPQLKVIAASQQGGSRGAQIWGVTEDFTLMTNYQETPGGTWSGWFNWENAPQVVELAACQQNNGCVQLWAIDLDGALKTTSQTSPGGGWTNWTP